MLRDIVAIGKVSAQSVNVDCPMIREKMWVGGEVRLRPEKSSRRGSVFLSQQNQAVPAFASHNLGCFPSSLMFRAYNDRFSSFSILNLSRSKVLDFFWCKSGALLVE